ncbi:MAG: trigger factor [Thermodesulfobacteriota bacterium]
MQVTIEEKSPVKKLLHITVPAEDVAAQVDKAYADLKKNAKVKGFRPGKAPRSVLERLYKEEVESDVTQKIISDSFAAALVENKLRIVGPPRIDTPVFSKGEAYAFSAEVEVVPEIADLSLSGIAVTKNKYAASEAEVERQIELLRRNMGHYEPIAEERPAQTGDFVLLDYEGAGDWAKTKELARNENFILELGAGKVVPGFEDQIVGMKKGEEKTITVNFPEDYASAALAGKEVQMRVALKDIRKRVLPPVDDALAKDLGDYKTLEDLKKAIRENLQAGYDKRADQEVDEQVYQELLSRSPFEVPDTLVEHEIKSMVDDFERTLSYRNMSLEDVGADRDKLAVTYRQAAIDQVRRYLVLDKIVEQEKIQLADERLDEAFADMSKSLRQPAEAIRSYYQKDPEQLEMLKHTLLQKEALAFVKAQSQITEVTPPPEPAPEQAAE